MKQRPIDALAIAALAILMAIAWICYGRSADIRTGPETGTWVLVVYVAPIMLAVALSIRAVFVIWESER